MTNQTSKSKVGVEYDPEAQKNLAKPLGSREMYPYPMMGLAQTLKEQGITFAFGVSGGHVWQVVDSISRIGIKTLIVAHEQNAVHIAEAYAQVSRRPAVCFGTAGPGVANGIAAMQQAWLSNTPVLFVGGGHEISHDGLYTIQESYSHKLLAPITKMSQRIILPSTIKQFTTRAFKEMQTYPYGPAFLEMTLDSEFLPWEVMSKAWFGWLAEHTEYVPDWRREETAKPISLGGGDAAEVAKAVQQIYAAKAPFVLIGDGAHWADAGPEIQEFVELAQVPFTTRRLGRGTVSEKHPLAVRGMPGGIGKSMDQMVSVGLKVGFFDGYGAGWPQTIQVSESIQHVWTYLNTSATVIGNPKAVFRQMIDYAKANNLQPPAGRSEWVSRCQKAQEDTIQKRRDKAKYYGFEHPRYRQNNFMHYGYVAQATADYLEEQYGSRVRVVIDGYTIADFAPGTLVATRSAQVLGPAENGTVGHGVPMAIGAALADSERGDRTPVLALMGDAGMHNTGYEIELAVRMKLPVVYLVTNNDGWLTGAATVSYGEKWDTLGEQDRKGVDFMGAVQLGQEKLPGLRYDKMAELYGAYGETVNRHEDFAPALHRAFQAAEQGQPAVLNCIMDKRMVNKAMFGPAGTLMAVHIPYEELPKTGKIVRQMYFSHAFEGLKELPPVTPPDSWDLPADDEE